MHLDISYTGLDAGSIKRVGAALSKARSLVSIHMNGNPGITDVNVDFIRERLVCKDPIDKIIKIEFENNANKKTLKSIDVKG